MFKIKWYLFGSIDKHDYVYPWFHISEFSGLWPPGATSLRLMTPYKCRRHLWPKIFVQLSRAGRLQPYTLWKYMGSCPVMILEISFYRDSYSYVHTMQVCKYSFRLMTPYKKGNFLNPFKDHDNDWQLKKKIKAVVNSPASKPVLIWLIYDFYVACNF